MATFEENKREELDRCRELQGKIEELTTSMGVALESVGADNLPSRSDFATMKEDLSFRENELEKSKMTLEGLSSEQTQLKVNLEKIEALEEKIRTEMETLKSKLSHLDDELRMVSDLDRLRADAAEKRRLLESEHLSLGARKTAAVQNANSVQVSCNLNFCGGASEASETTLYSGRNHPPCYYPINRYYVYTRVQKKLE